MGEGESGSEETKDLLQAITMMSILSILSSVLVCVVLAVLPIRASGMQLHSALTIANMINCYCVISGLLLVSFIAYQVTLFY